MSRWGRSKEGSTQVCVSQGADYIKGKSAIHIYLPFPAQLARSYSKSNIYH